MNRAKLNRINNPKVKPRAPTDFTPADKVQFLAELKAWGEMKGYKPGWAAVQWKERFYGQWPPWKIKDTPAAVNVGAETMAYLNKRKREWQKAKKAELERLYAEAGQMPSPKDDWIDLAEWQI